ncbi:MFS transporter [Gordonia sp. CPCC 205515]|uniref:MFS transporter n=1 Tax=Gordonia sp. CPCC 205515 TaxID=3140791 RepID=UPI003AF3F110
MQRTAPVGRTGLALLVAALVVDGLDTAALPAALPAIAADWGIHPTSLTRALMLTALGTVLGYLGSGALTRRWGRQTVVWRSVLMFGLATLPIVVVAAEWQMEVVRFVTGIGLGLVLPAAVSIGGDLMPRQRQSAAMVVVLGLAAGNLLGGLIFGPLIAEFGWRAAFVVPAVVAIPVAVAIARWPGVDGRRPVHSPNLALRPLLQPSLRVASLALWAGAFTVFLAYSILQSWLPSMAVVAGASPQAAPLTLAAMAGGGLAGGLVAAGVRGRAGLGVTLVVMLVIAAAALLITAALQASALPLLAVAGAGLIAGAAGLAALAVQLYPRPVRIIGVGVTAAFGRVATIVAPVVGAVMMRHDHIAALMVVAGGLAVLSAGLLWIPARTGSAHVRTRVPALSRQRTRRP